MPDKLNISADELSATPLGHALYAGRLVATVVGSNDHITIKAQPKAKVGGRWQSVNFDEATHVFVSVPGADGGFPDRVGTYYPSGKYEGCFFSERTSDADRVKAALYVLNAAAGRNDGKHVMMESFCLRCGRPLTEPESIKLGFGPDCLPHVQSQHQKKVKDHKGEGTPTDKRTPDQKWQDNEGGKTPEPPSHYEKREATTDGLITLAPGESATDRLAKLGEGV